MNKIKRNSSIRAVAVILAVLMLAAIFASCTGGKEAVADTVLECGEEKLPLYFYEFMLSRMKGALARYKYEVTSPDFWDTKTEDGQTYEEYYNASILENCKNYLAAAVLFDRQGLKLSDATLAEIDEEIAFYVNYDGGKDVKKFNSLVSKFGVDADTLRECYIIEAKYEYVIADIYGGGSLIDGSVKEEFYRENYVRFKQILLPKFYYEYELDSEGDPFYFDPESGLPLYDTAHGYYRFDKDGNCVKDRYGEVIYYDADGNIAYDKVNGQPSVKLDESGAGVSRDYTAEELAEIESEAKALSETLKSGKFTAFEEEKAKHVNILGAEEAYPDGYYLSRTEAAGYDDYLVDILELLETMEVGDIGYYESEYGYHVIMKYELDEGKYSDGKYAEWFTKLESALVNMLFLNKVSEILPDITVNEEALAKARSIRNIGTNYDY